MGILKQFFNNTRKPDGWMGKMMVNGMNQGHAAVSDWGLSYFPDVPGVSSFYAGGFRMWWRTQYRRTFKTVSGGKSDSPGLFQGRLRQNKAIQSE